MTAALEGGEWSAARPGRLLLLLLLVAVAVVVVVKNNNNSLEKCPFWKASIFSAS